MITIIHGDDVTNSRNIFYSEKSKIKNPVIFDKNNFDLTLFLQVLSGKSLFAEEKNIFLDNLLSSKNISPQQLKEVIGKINKSQSPTNIFIWEGTELGKTFLNQFPKALVKSFKLPQSVFSFVDSIKPNNSQNVILFHNALKNSDDGFLFSMLVRQFRLLLALREESSSPIDDLNRLSPWQRDKLFAQSKLFLIEELKRIYKALYKIDLNVKTGVYGNFTTAIDFLLIDI